jgi:DNA-binding response OmpR family regulator
MLNEETPIMVLSLSPSADDYVSLAEILQPYEWTIHRASTLLTATQLLEARSISVVICERDLPPYSWRDLLAGISGMAKPPFLIVTSSHADDYLWAEALNLGAYDVLAKPFHPAEVRRTLSMAALHWQWNQELALPAARASKAH